MTAQALHQAKVTVQRAGADIAADAQPAYTFGTLVTDTAHYDAMRQSFVAGGFTETDCEFLFIDNTGSTQVDAFRGLNALLDRARAKTVILCHQDIRLLGDDRATLDARLADISVVDPNWAVAGNAGGIEPGRLALRITDPHGANQKSVELPQRVATLDENLLIVRRASRVGFSHDLSGFHLYGADLCLHASLMGCACYVIDFHLQHLSGGNKNQSFVAAEDAFVRKWSAALQPRWLQTTCTLMRLSPNAIDSAAGRMVAPSLAKAARHINAFVERRRNRIVTHS